MPARVIAKPRRRLEDHDPTKADAVDTAVALEHLQNAIDAADTARKNMAVEMTAGFKVVNGQVAQLMKHVDDHDKTQTASMVALQTSVQPLLDAFDPFIKTMGTVRKYAFWIICALLTIVFFGGPVASKLAMDFASKLIGN